VRVSVIIPVLNESEQIADVIARTRKIGDSEIVVVDGGSTDGTIGAASAAEQVLSAPRGRALQQNAGAAAAATADVLLFLHADCRLPDGAFDAIATALQDPRCVGGCFRQRIDSAGAGYRLLEFGNAWRVKLLGWAYGDQGIFVRRETFESLGGFPELPLLEDLFFVKQLKRRGRLSLLPVRLEVSARRWRKHGVIRQTLRNWRLILRAHCGVPLQQLAAKYKDVR
jgi:rSAM/selenodomain-associated transferase 2